MLLLKRFSFYVAVAGVIAAAVLIHRLSQQPPAPAPLAEPAASPYSNCVAATGLIEASRENVKIAAPQPGLILKVFVQVDSKVKTGDPLLQLDDRAARAQLINTQAQLDAMRATLEMEKVTLADAEDQFNRTDRLAKEEVASVDERIRKDFARQSAAARVTKSKADIKSVETQVEMMNTNLEILTVRAPRDGTILQVNVREGEYAGTTPADPLMLLGDIDKLQVRAEVDEQNAPLIKPNEPAVAFLKGETTNPIQLHFVRIEPFVIPKKSLTGDSTERVDTRVLQIIFELDRPATPLYVGQQMDVFIQRPDGNIAASR
jgi:HlyD family secretion protein